ncbi:MAG: hypothetical protein WB989_16875, partial [Mycobacterium sp.]
MINLATGRLAPWAERAKVVLADGSLPLPADDWFADRGLSRLSAQASSPRMSSAVRVEPNALPSSITLANSL